MFRRVRNKDDIDKLIQQNLEAKSKAKNVVDVSSLGRQISEQQILKSLSPVTDLLKPAPVKEIVSKTGEVVLDRGDNIYALLNAVNEEMVKQSVEVGNINKVINDIRSNSDDIATGIETLNLSMEALGTTTEDAFNFQILLASNSPELVPFLRNYHRGMILSNEDAINELRQRISFTRTTLLDQLVDEIKNAPKEQKKEIKKNIADVEKIIEEMQMQVEDLVGNNKLHNELIDNLNNPMGITRVETSSFEESDIDFENIPLEDFDFSDEDIEIQTEIQKTTSGQDILVTSTRSSPKSEVKKTELVPFGGPGERTGRPNITIKTNRKYDGRFMSEEITPYGVAKVLNVPKLDGDIVVGKRFYLLGPDEETDEIPNRPADITISNDTADAIINRTTTIKQNFRKLNETQKNEVRDLLITLNKKMREKYRHRTEEQYTPRSKSWVNLMDVVKEKFGDEVLGDGLNQTFGSAVGQRFGDDVFGGAVKQVKYAPFKLIGDMIGNLRVNTEKLIRDKLLDVQHVGGQILYQNVPVDDTFIELLTKRYNRKIPYSDQSIALFREMVQGSGLQPSKNSKKMQLLNRPVGASIGEPLFVDANEMVRRVGLLTSGIMAGNAGKMVLNELSVLLDKLLNLGHISRAEHKFLFQKYGLA